MKVLYSILENLGRRFYAYSISPEYLIYLRPYSWVPQNCFSNFCWLICSYWYVLTSFFKKEIISIAPGKKIAAPLEISTNLILNSLTILSISSSKRSNLVRKLAGGSPINGKISVLACSGKPFRAKVKFRAESIWSDESIKVPSRSKTYRLSN